MLPLCAALGRARHYRSTLGKHEIAVIQATEVDAEGGMVLLATTLAHSSGEWIAARWPVCRVADLGSPQLMGAALTYARRYGLFALAGLAGEEDLDAAGLLGSEVSDGAGEALSPVTRHSPPMADGDDIEPLTECRPDQAGSQSLRGGKKGGTARIASGSASTPLHDPAAELARVEDADGLFRWALQVLPTRNTLDEAKRAALDAAFLARAEAIGADPELLLPFRSDPVAANGDALLAAAQA